ncbi:MAG: carboxypeptidase-like regulatory domain-containing protein [Mangrovibacterium sp.]
MKQIILAVSLFFMVLLLSCNENDLDIENYGSVSGKIYDGETYQPVAGALVTTSPASISVLSDAEGNFAITRVQEGEVAVNVKKKDYLSNTLSVAVYNKENTVLNFLIFKDDDDLDPVSLYDPVPGNGASEQATAFTFKWSVESEGSVGLTYNIYIFESNSTVQKVVGEDISVTEVGVSGLKYSTTYFWYVVAKYEGNKIANSPTWSFKTRDN